MKAILALALLVSAGFVQAGDVDKGKALFGGKCASCHGKDGKGNAAMAKMFKAELAAMDLVDAETLGKSDEDLAALTQAGKGKMPAFKDKLSAEEIADILAYVRSLGKPEAKPAEEKAAAPEGGPADVKMDKTGKLAPVTFPHTAHAKRNACADCHEGEKPLFEPKRSETGYKMADMYKGDACGACHDGKKAFAAKTSCGKCHKK